MSKSQKPNLWPQFWQQVAQGKFPLTSEMDTYFRSLAGAAAYSGHPEISSRPPVMYDVEPLSQRPAECMQTAAAMLLRYHSKDVSVDKVLAEVPVYEKDGKKIGTAPGHIGAYIVRQGIGTTAYIGDTELFPSYDPSHQDGCLDPKATVQHLEQRLAHVKEHRWLKEFGEPVVDGWRQFAQAGGRFQQARITDDLLYGLLGDGPYFAMLSSTVLNGRGRRLWSKAEGRPVPDDLRGESSTHGVIIAGGWDSSLLVADPRPPEGESSLRQVPVSRCVEAIAAAATQSANVLLVPDFQECGQRYEVGAIIVG